MIFWKNKKVENDDQLVELTVRAVKSQYDMVPSGWIHAITHLFQSTECQWKIITSQCRLLTCIKCISLVGIISEGNTASVGIGNTEKVAVSFSQSDNYPKTAFKKISV